MTVGDTPAVMREDPLRVDWLEPSFFVDGLPGRVGLTFLPGKRGWSTRYADRWYERDLAADLADLERSGVRRLVLLIQDDELEQFGSREIVERGREHGVEVIRRPIRDRGVPESVAEMDEIVERIDETRGRAGDVAVACLGGIGRAGTVAACSLVAQGMTADEAIQRVRAARHPEAVESDDQQRFVAAYERHRRRSGAGRTSDSTTLEQAVDERLDDRPST